MKSRIAILGLLVSGMLFSTAGAGLAIQGGGTAQSGTNAAVSQYETPDADAHADADPGLHARDRRPDRAAARSPRPTSAVKAASSRPRRTTRRRPRPTRRPRRPTPAPASCPPRRPSRSSRPARRRPRPRRASCRSPASRRSRSCSAASRCSRAAWSCAAARAPSNDPVSGTRSPPRHAHSQRESRPATVTSAPAGLRSSRRRGSCTSATASGSSGFRRSASRGVRARIEPGDAVDDRLPVGVLPVVRVALAGGVHRAAGQLVLPAAARRSSRAPSTAPAACRSARWRSARRRSPPSQSRVGEGA